MRILQVVEAVDPKMGGVAEGTFQQAKELISRGHEVEILTGEETPVKRFEDIGAKHTACSPVFKPWRWTPETKRWLNANIDRFDAVILRGLWQHPMLAARQAAVRAGVPCVLFCHGMMDPYFLRTPRQKLIKRLYWSLFEGKTAHSVKAIIFTAELEEKLARETWDLDGVDSALGYGIEDPHDADRADTFCKKHNLKPGEYLLYMSRIHPKKGLDMLIKALAKLDDSTRPVLAICGDDSGAHADELKALAAGNTSIRWCGFASGAEKREVIANSQAMILPSHQENFGIIVVEAMALGRPVLTTNRVNIWREVESNEAGLIEDPTQKGTDQLLERFFSMSVDEREQMGENARNLFCRRFEVKAAVDKLLEVLESPK
jgi:glycosyltransferase involved in cell wall biosynthesis